MHNWVYNQQGDRERYIKIKVGYEKEKKNEEGSVFHSEQAAVIAVCINAAISADCSISVNSIANYNQTYHEIVDHLTIANTYNIQFKEQMDESLYKVVVGYVSMDNIAMMRRLKTRMCLSGT